MTTEWEILANALRKEVQEYGGLLNLFGQQQEAIIARDPDLVLAMADLLEAQVQTIDACCKERDLWVQKIALRFQRPPGTPLKELIESCPEPVFLLMTALIDEINSLVARAKHRARQNQMLLSRSIDISQQILQRLNPCGVVKTYSSSGRANIAVSAEMPRAVAI